MSFERNMMSKIKFVVNPTGVITDLFAKRFEVEGIIKGNPEKKEHLKRQNIIGTPLDTEIVKAIRKDKQTFSKYPSILTGENIYSELSILSYKKPEEMKKSIFSKAVHLYDCPEDSIDEIMELVPTCESVLQTEAGEKVISQTVEYKNSIFNLWERCSESLSDYIREVVGEENLQGNEKELVVSVRAPLYKNQRSYGEEKNRTIFYYSQAIPTSDEERKKSNAYTVSALCHEKVHETLLPYKMHMTQEEKKKFHAFIKFLTDKEIYHMIMGESYLDINTVNENDAVMAKVYPYWLGYLHRKDSNPVLEIQKDINRDRKAFEKLEDNSVKKQRYSLYNFDKLSAQKIAHFFVGKRAISPYEFSKIDFDNRDAVEVDTKTRKRERI